MSDKIDKKELKGPDTFLKITNSIIGIFSKYKKLFLAIGAFFILGYIASIFYNEYKDSKENEASFLLSKVELKLNDNKGKLNSEIENGFIEIIDKYKNTEASLTSILKLADLYYNEKEYDKGYNLFQKAYDKSSQKLVQTVALINIAYIKEIQKDYKTALNIFEKVLSLDIDVYQIEAYFGMARAQESLHEKEQAKATYNKIISKYPNSEHAKTAKKFLLMLEVE